jgi:tRNA pseudouridine38-40 synthase
MAHERTALLVRYDGTDFAGSQIQPEGRTVARTLKTGLESILGQDIHLLFAGRTDAGVHADGNVAAFDAQLPFPAEKLADILRSELPYDLEIRKAAVVGSEFHPRFDAVERQYIYRIYRSSDVPVDRRRYVYPLSHAWDTEVFAAAIRRITGRHSFVAFARGEEDADQCYCDLKEVRYEVTEEAGREVELIFTADRFLRQMICRLVGALVAIATGNASLEWLDKAMCGEVDFSLKPAPPRGLTLRRVGYPQDPFGGN